MRIGIDFDNTIVNYHNLFHEIALKEGLIDRKVGKSKVEVRDHLNSLKKVDEFTALQGKIYGKYIILAKVFDGFSECLNALSAKNYELFIISHKSQFPLLGEQNDLHVAAKNFLEKNKLLGRDKIPYENVYFLETLNLKIQTAIRLNLDLFIDDLLDVVTNDRLTSNTNTIWFNPLRETIPKPGIDFFTNWSDLCKRLHR